jgi:hypothetical protein
VQVTYRVRLLESSTAAILTCCSPTTPVTARGSQEHYKNDIASAGHRATVGAVLAELRPKLQFHGHYHFAHDTVVEPVQGTRTRVVGSA